jgi:aromatic amino acid aminotransferase I
MDSFSKVLVPGSRLGWITASAQIIERFLRHAEVANQGPSGVSQIMLWKLLDETWGHEGYIKWLISLKNSYTKKRDNLLAACDKYLPKSVVSWSPPTTGMFVSIPSFWWLDYVFVIIVLAIADKPIALAEVRSVTAPGVSRPLN